MSATIAGSLPMFKLALRRWGVLTPNVDAFMHGLHATGRIQRHRIGRETWFSVKRSDPFARHVSSLNNNYTRKVVRHGDAFQTR